ncbi:non-hydrolyzing UDP-N-acetylglucosamine 2-epimerase [Rugamonas sp. CCM 8940]|uniref:non-hydrolyzing UDP-N-acetylglucosamine 2-epimerase n=1 Tax=Rugamonas sp. CCM 8940 TaxID=2765359 RepID=UPI0018F35BF3|nr:UDP-N-acetylglucosamine 2-epimerase (non-hydrolyzing) [Rugamonas sp. CCM 8940]MBJ7312434.1 UDP-N-acetylglucosamine 2-epimerase (non-hydrolyzing) [Rugamonas sp. CCM 8940]
MTAIQHPPLRILCVVGARPNFMKIAPILTALKAHAPAVEARLLHTGQHYDVAMNSQYFEALGIPAPDDNLEVGSGSHAAQTAEVMLRVEKVLDQYAPDALLVVGDVNSTLACALVAAKKGIAVVHVEAGLRSGDRAMPEEINRVLTDQLSDLLFTTEESAADNLRREGVAAERIHFVGNVMIDTLLHNLPRAVSAATLAEQHGRPGFGAGEGGYGVLTLHRPSNVDQAETLAALLDTALRIGASTPLMFPVHPRTRAAIERFGLGGRLDAAAILPLPPMGYLEMLGLMKDARLVLTDSGGIQEETTALGVPCITLRENTERPITVEQGTNTIAGTDPARILALHAALLADGGKRGRQPRYWDGQAAVRIAAILLDWLERRRGGGHGG